MTNRADSIVSPQFITIEGGEGAGKTTLIDHLEHLLLSWKVSVVRTREPGGTPFGDQIRQWLLTHSANIRIDAKAELLLFLASRAQHIDEVITPAIQSGQVVLCDRFNDSTVAYQGAGRGQGTVWVRSLCEMVCDKVVPDLTLYLDVDPKIGLERARKTAKVEASVGELDRIEGEQLEFHQRIREAFLTIARDEPGRFYCIDAAQSKQAVIDTATVLISQRFGKCK